MKRKAIVLGALLALGIFAGCGDDGGGDPDTTINPTEDAGSDVSVDAGFDAAPDASDDGGGFDGGDVGEEPDGSGQVAEGSSCAEPTDLGTLAAGEVHNFNTSLLEPDAALTTTCDPGTSNTGVRVYSFQVETLSRVELWTTLSPSTFDLRAGGCESPSEVLTCTSGGQYTAELQSGQTYHLVVWGDINIGASFTLRATVQEAVCSVDDGDWCENGEYNECVQNVSVRSSACIDDCLSGTQCRGDICAGPIPVDMSSGATVTHTGNTRAYTSEFDADPIARCATDGPGNADGPSTPNAEQFFEVSGLSAGQTLVVDSKLQGDYAFFVLESCGANECVGAADSDDAGNDRLVWEVPADGSYIVVVEKFSVTNQNFEFSFELQSR